MNKNFCRSDDHAKTLVTFCKRITFEDAYRRTESGDDEKERKSDAYVILEAISDLKHYLNGAGFYAR